MDYDVIIVGAGPAGSSAAIRLAENGVRVLVLEEKRMPREKLGVLLLDVRRVREHHRTEITRCRRTPDCSRVLVPHEEGKAACVIDVGVREHDGIDAVHFGRALLQAHKALDMAAKPLGESPAFSATRAATVGASSERPLRGGRQELHAAAGGTLDEHLPDAPGRPAPEPPRPVVALPHPRGCATSAP